MRKRVSLLAVIMAVLLFLTGCTDETFLPPSQSQSQTAAEEPFQILMSADMKPYEGVLKAYFSSAENAPGHLVTYEGIADIQRILEADECVYDAVWLSNSIPLHMLRGGQTVNNSRFTGISPVVFGMKETLAAQLGYGQDISMNRLLEAVKEGRFTLTMPSVTQDNSGRSAYIAILYALAGSPKVLTADMLDSPVLQEGISQFFANVDRAAGSEDFVIQTALYTSLECIVASEAALIRLNRQLEASGKEPFRLLYPVDGITIGDAPLAYISKGDGQRLEQFLALQDFVLSAQGQELLAQAGMRTDLGGLIAAEHQDIFREDWGIRGNEYINTLVYPASDVIRKALTLYQEELRKPAYIVFCLDFSGSMSGNGERELIEAMHYILNPETASSDYIQLMEKDEIVVIRFDSDVKTIAHGNGAQSLSIYETIARQSANGSTSMYGGIESALTLLKDADNQAYSTVIINMTDGSPTDSDQFDLRNYYGNKQNPKIPIYSIMFGNATERYVQSLAQMSGGKVFDGKEDLTKAFREVMGYN